MKLWMAGLLTLAFCGAGLGCGRPVERSGEGPLQVVATTTIVGDIVARVGGDAVAVYSLLPYEADPHDYIFRPADVARAIDADLLFINGAGLEGHLDRLVAQVARDTTVVSLERGIPIRALDAYHGHYHEPGDHTHSEACVHGDGDPHYWEDPHHVMIWARTIAQELSAQRPEQAKAFDERAEALIAELAGLDEWIVEQVARIPPERRKLVTDHLSLGYFADRYGFEQVGVILRSFDSMAQASAREVGHLIDTLKELDVPALFVGAALNPNLARQIAADTGTELVVLQHGSLTAPDGDAPDYFAYMRYNVEALVRHLGDGD
jgi:ABC-type Zn uptake system ZnuABC Zn-binding protein ZnuA